MFSCGGNKTAEAADSAVVVEETVVEEVVVDSAVAQVADSAAVVVDSTLLPQRLLQRLTKKLARNKTKSKIWPVLS